MKSALVLLGEMLTFVLMCFFGVLSILTPWCTWRIICIVLCSIFGIIFIALFFLSRNPKYKFVADETIPEEEQTNQADENQETEDKVEEEIADENQIVSEETKVE